MLEDGLRPYSPTGAFHASCDIVPKKKGLGTASEPNITTNCSLRTNTINTAGEDLCDADSVSGNQVENNTFQYQLNQVTEVAVGDLGFLDSSQQEKENGDLLYCGWPEIETFEDVDKMFRSCDSTFGLGIDNEDELSWFSSSHAIEESNDALKQDFMFSGPDSDTLNDATDCDEALRLNDAACVINETHEKDVSVFQKSSIETLFGDKNADFISSSFENESETTAQIEAGDQSMSKQSQKKPHTYGKRRGLNLESGNHLDKPNQMGDVTQHTGCSFSETTEFEQSTPLQTRNKPFTVKCEDNGGQSLFKNNTSYASNHVQHKQSCHGVSFQIPGVAAQQGKSSLHHEHDPTLAVQSTYCNPKKKIVNFESDVDGQSTVDQGGSCNPGELDSSHAQNSACLTSMADEVSIEASTFRQLQHIIEKLDVKTKLCIRDSLYRLARSAEQRQMPSEFTIGGGSQVDGYKSGILASDDTDKSTRFMDMETDTNPIDRSVAHLLFHRPSDNSVLAAVDTPLTKAQIRSSEKAVPQESSYGVGFGASTVE